MHRIAALLAILFCTSGIVNAADGLARQTWKIDGVEREALVYLPESAKTTPSPVIFSFHGHGGKMKGQAAMFACEKAWPQAICVYPQGLPTVGVRDPDAKLPGWQHAAGDTNDRDLKFFDAMLNDLKQNYKVDDNRVYSTGFSNGGGFTMLLWATRGDVLAAAAPCAGGAGQLVEKFKPKPVMIVTGEKDPLVKIDAQKQMIEALRKLNGCEAEGKSVGTMQMQYESKTGTPVVTYIHPGPHTVPKEAPPLIVKFFKEQSRK